MRETAPIQPDLNRQERHLRLVRDDETAQGQVDLTETEARQPYTRKLELRELLGVEPGQDGRYYSQGGTSGRRWSKYAEEQVLAHEAQIRLGLRGLKAMRMENHPQPPYDDQTSEPREFDYSKSIRDMDSATKAQLLANMRSATDQHVSSHPAPAQAPQPGWKDRLRNASSGTKQRLQGVVQRRRSPNDGSGGDGRTPEERKRGRRRGAIGAIALLLAAGVTAAVLADKDPEDQNDSATRNPTPSATSSPQPSPTENPTIDESEPTPPITGEEPTDEPPPNVVDGKTLERKSKQAVRLSPGGNPWQVAENQLPDNASIRQIDQVKDAILRINHLSEAESYYLPVGFELRLPIELIDRLNGPEP